MAGHHSTRRRDNGLVEVVRMILERGADPTVQDKDGRTPLHEASLWGHVEVVRMILERGADPTVQDKDGRTPLHLASLGDM
jgi:ankyrin repeat protein